MIEIKNLSFTYPGVNEPVLKNINLKVAKGEFVAIIGNNGCGKSTLCKTLNGLIPRFITGEISGEILLDNQDALKMDINEIAQKVGYVYQDFENQIVCPTVYEDASFACMNYGKENYEQSVLDILDICDLTSKKDDYIWQLSGGQLHLLALAGATALYPDILILDEPIAQLDPKHANKIYHILKDLNENHGKTIIVIEHHSEYIARFCKQVVLMKDGTIKWKKPVKQALVRVDELQESNIFPPQITIAAKMLQNQKIVSDQVELPITKEDGLKFFTKKSVLINKATNYPANPSKEAVVEFVNVDLQYQSVKGKPVQILKDFYLDIYKGDKIALIGSNGAGKSTLMKLMVGLLKPKDGKVRICGNSTNKFSAEQLSEYISLVYQNPEDMFIKDSIKSDIEFAMKERKIQNYHEKAQALIKLFNLEDIQDRDGRLMSGGQMRRASLAIGIALNPAILLLDEPTANLDIATRKEIIKTLDILKDIVETVIIATHDMQLVCDWAKRIIVLSAGKIIKDGSRDVVFSDQNVRETVGIEPPEIYKMGEALNIHCYEIDEFVSAYR
ncbi:ABC transporter ATP-binding protein [uncultured Thomasclavelia sp.]|uniref:ABC transporter ATP-binding protein n=1 Tax=uncultured Thomasclavelia sp. TaxID=3025759 RepID=UPI0025E04784|nr:energy-coupling factor transporter ATPase [uncultured Thomasclavelia sp.]